MKHNVSDLVSNGRSPGLAYRDEGNPRCHKALRQHSNLGGLSSAFSSLEYDQPPARHSQDRVMIGLAAPFFMPSMIH